MITSKSAQPQTLALGSLQATGKDFVPSVFLFLTLKVFIATCIL